MKLVWTLIGIIITESTVPDLDYASGDDYYPITDDEEFAESSGDYYDTRDRELLADAVTSATAMPHYTTYETELAYSDEDEFYESIENIMSEAEHKRQSNQDETSLELTDDEDELELLPDIEQKIVEGELEIMTKLNEDEEAVAKIEQEIEDLKNQRADIVRTSTFEETFTVDDKEEEVVTPDEVIDPLYDDDDDEATNGDNEDIYETVYEQLDNEMEEIVEDAIVESELEEENDSLNTIILATVMLGAIVCIAALGLVIHRLKKKNEGSYRIANSPSSTQALLSKNEEAYA